MYKEFTSYFIDYIQKYRETFNEEKYKKTLTELCSEARRHLTKLNPNQIFNNPVKSPHIKKMANKKRKIQNQMDENHLTVHEPQITMGLQLQHQQQAFHDPHILQQPSAFYFQQPNRIPESTVNFEQTQQKLQQHHNQTLHMQEQTIIQSSQHFKRNLNFPNQLSEYVSQPIANSSLEHKTTDAMSNSSVEITRAEKPFNFKGFTPINYDN